MPDGTRHFSTSAAAGPPESAPVGQGPVTVCTCGHGHPAHQHYRRGTDCGTCGADVCPRFRVRRPTLGDRLCALLQLRTNG